MWPRNATRRAGLNATPHPLRGGRIGVEKERERGAPLPRIYVQRPARDVADHDLGREFVVLDAGGLVPLTGQKGDQRAQHFARTTEPFPRDLDDRMRPTGFAQVVEHQSGFPAPAHEGRPPSSRSEGIPERQRPLVYGALPVATAIKSRVVRCGSSARNLA